MDLLTMIFKNIVNITFTASIIGLIILLIRYLFKTKISLRFNQILLIIVLIRFCMPIVPQSSISILNILPQIDNEIENTISENMHSIHGNIDNEQIQRNSTHKNLQDDYIKNNNESLQDKSNMSIKREFSIINILSILWLVGFLIVIIGAITLHYRLVAKFKNCKILDDKNLLISVDECKNNLGIKENVNVYVGSNFVSPYIIGVINPNIYIPEALMNIEPKHFKHVILHELSHYKRKDLIYNIFSIIAIAIHWFNPFIWVVTHIIKSDIELACDNYVLNKLGEDNAISYGKTILEVTRLFLAKQNRIGLACHFNTHKQLERRITMIKKFKNSSYKITALTIVGSLLIGSLVLTNPIYAKQKSIKSNTTNQEVGNKVSNKNSAVSEIAQRLGVSDKTLDKYKTEINKTVTKDGISITVNEAVLNNDELIVSANIKFDEAIGGNVEQYRSFYSRVFINGERIRNVVSSRDKIVDEYNMKSVMGYYLEGNQKGDLDVKIAFANSEISDEEWVLEFKISGDKLANDTKEILVNHTFTIKDDMNVTIHKYISNSLEQAIYYSSDFEERSGFAQFRLEGHDDLGNKVTYNLSDVGDDEDEVVKTYRSSTINVNAKKLYLTPYALKVVNDSDGLQGDKKMGKEFVIVLSK